MKCLYFIAAYAIMTAMLFLSVLALFEFLNALGVKTQ